VCVCVCSCVLFLRTCFLLLGTCLSPRNTSRARISAHVFVCCVCLCVNLCACECMSIYTYIYIYIYIYIYTYIYTHIHAYIHIHTHTYTYLRCKWSHIGRSAGPLCVLLACRHSHTGLLAHRCTRTTSIRQQGLVVVASALV
jgi:hypothetical protein